MQAALTYEGTYLQCDMRACLQTVKVAVKPLAHLQWGPL